LAEQPPLAELTALVEGLRGEAPPEAYSWMVETLGALQREQRDREALVKRSWSDSPFEDGEAGNEQTIEGFERELVGMLQQSRHGLGDSTVLGNAIDLAGAYKKNYKLDNAEAVLLRCTRDTEHRGGAWLVKYLNHLSQVRMKQARNVEALEMMYEMESLATFSLSEPGASSFYETLYRNMSCALRSMGREDESALYFTKMVKAARYHKDALEWMDLWELGILIANRAYQSEQWPEFYKSREILVEALRMQQVMEPHELILRAKILSNLGQCYLATGEHEDAEVYYSESYDLFNKTVGKRSPLFGMQAWACGNLRCAEGRHAEALPLLGEALYVEVVKDGLSVPEMTKLMDQILGCLHECREGLWDALDPEGATEPIRRALFTLIDDPRWHQLDDTLELAVLTHKMALVSVAARWAGPEARGKASRFSGRAVEILQDLQGKSKEAQRWAHQVDAVHKALFEDRAHLGSIPGRGRGK